MGQPVLQQGQLLGELPQMFLAVGQFGPHALVGDKRADGKMPRPLASNLLLAVAGGGDARGKLRVGVEQGHGDAGASGHRREADRLAALEQLWAVSVSAISRLDAPASMAASTARRALLSVWRICAAQAWPCGSASQTACRTRIRCAQHSWTPVTFPPRPGSLYLW